MFASLKPFDERKDASLLSFDVLKRLNAHFFAIKEAFVFALNPPSIPGMGTTGGFEFYLQNRGAGDARATGAAVEAFLAKAKQRPELQGVSTTYRPATQQLFVDLDATRPKCWAFRWPTRSPRCRRSSARRSPGSSRSSAACGG